MKMLNVHDVLVILAVTLVAHVLLKPLYSAIDNRTGGSQ